ncbi:MAG: hypothetical protein ACLP74_08010 [Thermoplasmata archaeon]
MIVVVIIVIAASAAVSVYAWHVVTQSNPAGYPPPPAGWTTYHTAWSAVVNAFGGFASGAWTIVFVEGVAADAPWSPPADLWGGTSPEIWDPCAAQLSGVSALTFWNSSAYPYSDSPDVFSSGAAPLWTFIFNGTGTPTFVATWLVGHVVINAALGSTSPCMLLSVFNSPPSEDAHPSTEVDSNVIAAAAFTESQVQLPNPPPPVPSPGEEAFALYMPGPERLLPSTISGANQWTVSYGKCGMPGELGSTFTMGEYPFNGTTGQGGEWLTSTIACYDTYYLLNMTSVPIPTPPSSSGVYREWNLNWSIFTSAVPATWSAADLTTSLLGWQLQSSSPPFSLQQSSSAVCGPADPGVANCTPPTQGWYAVLLNSNGSWLDSYPSVANGTAWTVPGVSLIPDDLVLFVSAAGVSTSASFQTAFGTEPTVFAGAVVG